MRSLRCARPWTFAARLLALSLALLFSRPAAADQLSSEPVDTGYEGIEELSYEAIVEASDDYAATLRIRVALHNASLSVRDAVHMLGLPFAAEVRALAVARNGRWTQGRTTIVTHEPERRDPGTVFVRQVDPSRKGDIPAAEVVAFGLEPGTTVQVEVVVRVHPRVHGDRWELDLPARGIERRNLAHERRVLVQGLAADQAFYVDEVSNDRHKVIVTRPQDMVTVSWPARVRSRSVLDGKLDVLPAAGGAERGEFHLYLRLGQTAPVKPDHVIALVDRSLSTPDDMPDHAMRALEGLFTVLPDGTTFDALAFDRSVTPLVEAAPRRLPRVDDGQARKRLAEALAARSRGQGTDLGNALAEAAARARKTAAERPLIVVMTDGMFPALVSPREIEQAFDHASARRRPEVLFIVDEPMLAQTGMLPSHPLAQVAAQLGARVSLETLSQQDASTSAELLGAPRVLGKLALELPPGAVLEDELPSGLVAGSFVRLRGRYTGAPPRTITVSGRFDSGPIEKRLDAVVLPERPSALAAVTEGNFDLAVREGFVSPPWYRDEEHRDAKREIAQAGRAGRLPRGHLTAKIFRYYLTTRVLPRARACYNRSLVHHRDQGGRVVLEIEVAKGEVMLARSRESELLYADAALGLCLTEAAWALGIPAGQFDDQIYRVRYPLQLIPPPPGQTSGSVERLDADDEIMEILLGQTVPRDG